MFANNKIISLCLLAVCFVAAAQAQVLFLGPCPRNVTVQSNFDVGSYLGVWYENSKYPAIFEVGGKCNVANYTLRSDGNVNVVNTMINKNTGKVESIEGYAEVVSNAKLLVTFPVIPNFKVSSNYWVLATDYQSYSVVYSCTPIGVLNLKHTVIAWILTRDRHANKTVINQAESVLTANGIPTDFLIKTEQRNCCAEESFP